MDRTEGRESVKKVDVFEVGAKGQELVGHCPVEDAYHALWKKYGMRLWAEVYDDQGVLYGVCKGEKVKEALMVVFENRVNPDTDKMFGDVEETFYLDDVGEEMSPMQAVRSMVRQLACRKVGKDIEEVMKGVDIA